MKVLITGGSGRLGKYLVREFPDSLVPTHIELDITDREKVFDYIFKHKPNIIIHTAALVDVRACQNDIKRAWKINVDGTENLVDAVFKFVPNCYFIYPSTACVFDGEIGDYTEEDTPNPKNYYGLTKVVAEAVVKKLPSYLIFRTDFVDRTKWKYEGAFVDRFSTSVFADTLARELKKIIEKKVTGLIHLTGKRKISHYELAKITTPDVKPIKIADVDLPLPRDQSLKSIKGGNLLELEY